MSDEFSYVGNLLGDLDFLGQDYEGPYKSAFKKPPYTPPMPEAISPAPEPTILDKAQDWFARLIGVDPDEAASRANIETINRREQMAQEQKQFEEDIARKGLFEARIPGANPEVGTPLDAMAGLLFSMPGGLGRGSFESGNLIGEMRGERADFLKGERTKPNPSEPVEDLTAAMELTPQEIGRNELLKTLASPKYDTEGSTSATIRLDALLNELAPTLGEHAAGLLNAPELKNLGFQYEPTLTGRYGEKGKVLYDPIELAKYASSDKSFAGIIDYMIRHELSHAEKPELGDAVTHALPIKDPIANKVGGIEGELFGSKEAIPSIIAGEARIGLPEGAFEHTRQGGEVRAGVEPIENIFVGRRDILEHDPYTEHLLGQLKANIEEAGLYGKLSGRKSTEVVDDLTKSMELPPEKQAARDRMEAQLSREEAQRKRDIEIDKLVQAGREAKLAGNVEEANKINAQVLELRNAPLPEIPAKPEVSTFVESPKPKLTSEQIIEKAVEAEKANRLVPKPTEEVKETSKEEGVISTPANILRKVLQETKLTKFNIYRLKDELKAKGIELPAEVEKAIPELIKELKDSGIAQEKVGGTYTLLSGAGKSMQAISGKKPMETTNIVESMKKTIEAKQATETPAKEVPAGKVPNLTENMKAKLTPEELQAIGKLFGGVVKKKGTKEVPEEVRLAQQAAIKGIAEKETKKAEGKPPEPPEELGEVSEGVGKQKPYEVTLNDGSTHIVRASTPEEAKFNAEKVLEEYGSTKIVDKVEEHLGTLERAAKHEIEPVKTGSEAVSEALKETKKSASEEVKETAKLGRTEEQLRKAQTKEKFEKKPFNVALSNGRTVVVKARNEIKAREIAESRIKKMGSGVTVESVGIKPSALEAAITGGARKLEESGFLNNPVVKVLNSIKSIAFGGDVGHLLRQGKQMNADLLFSKHAGKVLEQLPVIFKSAKSQEFFDKYNENMYNDPLTKRMVDDFGLDMPGMGAHYKEEAFHGAGLAEKAPIIGKYFAKPSERAYTVGLNFLRNAQIHKWAETLKKDGFTPDNAPEKYHAMARAVNIISQRGHFQPAYQKLFSDASAIYGAPRAKAARLQNAVELFRGGTSGRVVRQTAAKTLAFNLGLFGLLKATLGATFVTDSESSDAGKIRIGKKITIDPWMGLGVTARTVAKLVHGKAKSPYTGKEYPVSPSDALMQEFLGGVAPGVKLAWEALSGKDLRGYQVERLDSLLNVAPLTARSIAELLKEGDIDEAILLSILQAGGEGVDVFDYEKSKAEQQRLREERGLGSKKGRPKFPF